MNTTRLPSLFAPEPFLLDDAFRTFMRPFRWETPSDTPRIPIDVIEKDGVYTVTAPIPGVTKEDIHVEIDGRQVMITTEFKKPVFEDKDVRFLHSELTWGTASRLFTLAAEIDRARAEARYVDGVLTLTLPKAASSHAEPLKVK